ncbi:hypothetical protein PHYPSEUDO_012993 [Phytophthora pseudosyringae]|uniref:RxLR effector protein n=1 Tax=Phytophthora pseudosyringae TaxID=221518 RepID=A0A8T1W4F5_9STRA|nr:hypothetical protein PHYPSEUDO_012993 [Phytophthora pseudosyringae]
MRVGFVVLAAVATLLSSTQAKPPAAEPLSKQKFTVTSPNSNNAIDVVYIRRGGDKYVILHLDDAVAKEGHSGVNDRSSAEDDSASDRQEERAAPVNVGILTTVKEKLSTAKDNVLWYFFHALVPERFRTN